MIVLNVAEKPSVANSISKILSTSCNKTRGMHKYCPNIYFQTKFNSENSQMVFTSVLGHLFEFSFEDQGKWNESNPKDLFKEEIIGRINPEHKLAAENIKKLSERASLVVIWTDCDREGENIARQIKTIIETHRKVCIKRARFSAISRNEIECALENLTEINFLEADAVDARIELDLRIGSAFTRIQTISHNNGNVISFGPCQIPTLNFVVQRHIQIENFISEKYFSLQNTVLTDQNSKKQNDTIKNVFAWERKHLFDKNCIIYFYNVLRNSKAVISDKKVSNKEKYRPLPLRTVEFQKICSSFYKIDSHRLMSIAEKLYNNGYISYPRTETDSFPKSFGFKNIINKLKNDPRLGEYASNFAFVYPRSGSNNDQAHSPIYPLKDGSDLQGDERKIFEFISRRFLGCVSKNAKGVETEYTMNIFFNDGLSQHETFKCKGLNIVERNYLDVYIYDKWESSQVGDFRINEVVENNVEIIEGNTTKPEHLTESDLISLMDKNGIGTDATIHEHIHKIQTRGYVKKEKFKFIPLKLGLNLIKAYNSIGLPISEPTLRKNLEENLKKICEGTKNKNEIVKNEIQEYLRIYEKLEGSLNIYKEIMRDSEEPKKPEGGSMEKDSKRKKLKSNENIEHKKYHSSSVKKKAKSNADEYADVKFDQGVENTTNITKGNNKTGINKEDYCILTETERSKKLPKGQQELCDCGKEAKLLEAKKGENTGRMFLTCHFFPKKCSYFCWEDSPRHEPAKGSATERIINCFCGYEAQKKIANTESNRGREFYCCKKNYKKCKFFQWVDE
ncbi:uncharacterized protein VICG_01703 [Vittaforma corneae ATCC 50505]|uniref:DNA topoisomerase n=1 Tax=Vittaforma corneae (strain ATCC 50505) TaxID=993615 RepID=L2GKR2_VITCO|nr:uncharacterized protein VICG_01703 [Vittaforma corneae ATCC 50505]ELA41214.1 hypothetical protein VICG_01703 [Vittaforma corneae ATCC 50505]